MTSRAEKLGRIVALVKLQLRLSEWQLAELRQTEHALRDEEAYLIGTLNDTLPVGSSSASIARRLATTSIEARAVQDETSRQLDKVHAESRRARQIERVAKAAASDSARDAQRRTLEEIVLARPSMRGWTPTTN
jgi:hypothetical protein